MKTRYVLSCLLLGSALSVSAQKTAVKSHLLKAAKAEGSEEATYNLKIFFESNQTNIQ